MLTPGEFEKLSKVFPLKDLEKIRFADAMLSTENTGSSGIKNSNFAAFTIPNYNISDLDLKIEREFNEP